MNKYHNIEKVKIEKGFLVVMVDGQEIRKSISELSPILASASEEKKQAFEVSPSGYGIHWPLIDEDISVDGILREKIRR